MFESKGEGTVIAKGLKIVGRLPRKGWSKSMAKSTVSSTEDRSLSRRALM